MIRHLALVIGLGITTWAAADDTPKTKTNPKPQYERLLTGDDAKKATELEKQAEKAAAADDYPAAIMAAEELLALRTRVQGADHWEAVDQKWSIKSLKVLAELPIGKRAGWRKARERAMEADTRESKAQYADTTQVWLEWQKWCRKVFGENHPTTAASYSYLASNMDSRGKHADAEPLCRQVLEIRVRVLGENHPDTARSYNNLAFNLRALGNHREAELHYRKALAVRERILGEGHPDTGASYNNLASNLQDQGKAAEAELLFRKGLEARERGLGPHHSATGASYNNLASNLEAQGKAAEAEPLYRKALDIAERVHGPDHPDTATSSNNLGLNLQARGKAAEAEPLFRRALEARERVLGPDHPETAASYNNLAFNLQARGRVADAEPLFRKALEIRMRVFGPDHPETAASYNNLAVNLHSRGKVADAEPLFRKGLEARERSLGPNHPATAQSYNNLAYNLQSRGRAQDAELLYRKSLQVCERVLGPDHPETAQSYANLAHNLEAQGRVADAELLYRKALVDRERVLGPNHPATAVSYNNLARNLEARGKWTEAEPFFLKALEVRERILGPEHPETAQGYNNLASNLQARGRASEAEPLFRKALAIYERALGPDHSETAHGYEGLAGNLQARGRAADAETLYRKAVALRARVLGADHTDTAQSYNNLAVNLLALGKAAEAEVLFRKALAIRERLLGSDHPNTTTHRINLAVCQYIRGNSAEARAILAAAIPGYEACRLAVGHRGLKRAAFGAERSPYRLLAAVSASLGDGPAAWAAAEADSARGLLDQITETVGTGLTPAERDEQDRLTARLGDLQPRLTALTVRKEPTFDEIRERDDLRAERDLLDGRLSTMAVAASRRRVADLEKVRGALPADTALVLWVDVTSASGQVLEHWGCVVRAAATPVWERLPGTGPAHEWTTKDSTIPNQFRRSLSSGIPSPEIADLIRALHAQRLAPLEKHLAGAKQIIVVPTGEMAGVPVEVLTDKYAISYAPSGTFLAWLKNEPRSATTGVLALGDPSFPTLPEKAGPSLLPPGGLLVTQVVPGGAAAKARIQPGDVLLTYGGQDLKSLDRLKELTAASLAGKTVPVVVWRETQDKTTVRDVPPGQLGVVLDNRPAPEAVAARRKDHELFARLTRGGDWAELPGTAAEVAGLKALFGNEATTLIRDQASRVRVDALHAADKLSSFRYLHFATHGETNGDRAFESALILAGDKNTVAPLRAADVLANWKLNAELVTLSACETALGQNGGGDGLLGFAQAFLHAGSRAVCLSLWKVDDSATALFMDRFYRNLTGKRPELEKPLGKSAALQEAKGWLRSLNAEEAGKLLGDLTNGVPRGAGQPALKLTIPAPTSEKGDRPFAHPRFWAAFVLIGDPY